MATPKRRPPATSLNEQQPRTITIHPQARHSPPHTLSQTTHTAGNPHTVGDGHHPEDAHD